MLPACLACPPYSTLMRCLHLSSAHHHHHPQVVEKANKKAKLADKELDLYHLQDSDPLPAPELTAAVDRLFSGAEGPQADEAVLTGLASQVGGWVVCRQHCRSGTMAIASGMSLAAARQAYRTSVQPRPNASAAWHTGADKGWPLQITRICVLCVARQVVHSLASGLASDLAGCALLLAACRPKPLVSCSW